MRGYTHNYPKGTWSLTYHHLDFPWNDFATICDVGSGVGGFSLPLAKAYPKIKITLLDLPETINQAKAVRPLFPFSQIENLLIIRSPNVFKLWAKEYPSAVEENRAKFVDADFFVDIPVKDQDIYYVS